MRPSEGQYTVFPQKNRICRLELSIREHPHFPVQGPALHFLPIFTMRTNVPHYPPTPTPSNIDRTVRKCDNFWIRDTQAADISEYRNVSISGKTLSGGDIYSQDALLPPCVSRPVPRRKDIIPLTQYWEREPQSSTKRTGSNAVAPMPKKFASTFTE